VGPQIAFLKESGRVQFSYAKDDDVMSAYQLLASTEGVFAAMESSHTVAEVIKLAPGLRNDQSIVFNCSGRGDKDLFIVTKELEDKGFQTFLKDQVSS